MYFSFLETAYENDRLKTIGHNGMNYTFGYDSFGNLTQAQAGSRTLVTNTFKMNGTQLEKSILGNNTGTSYEYDQYEPCCPGKIC